jgi:hypothetical protein
MKSTTLTITCILSLLIVSQINANGWLKNYAQYTLSWLNVESPDNAAIYFVVKEASTFTIANVDSAAFVQGGSHLNPNTNPPNTWDYQCFYIDGSTQKGKDMYAMLLTAAATGQKFSIYLNGSMPGLTSRPNVAGLRLYN